MPHLSPRFFSFFRSSKYFCGNETRQFYQIGNAVPPLLAYKLALALKETYHSPIKQINVIVTARSVRNK